jgi:RHS repeat-associated protein
MLIPSHLQLEPSNSRTRVPAGGIDLIASIDFTSDGATTATLSSSTKVSHGEDTISSAEVATPNHSNQQYSIYAITNAAASIVERYAYTAYGQPTILNAAATVIATSAISNRYTYTAREWDATVGLYHFRARWMSGLTGRFLTRDPIGFDGSEWDLYEFLDGKVLVFSDPFGLGIDSVSTWYKKCMKDFAKHKSIDKFCDCLCTPADPGVGGRPGCEKSCKKCMKMAAIESPCKCMCKQFNEREKANECMKKCDSDLGTCDLAAPFMPKCGGDGAFSMSLAQAVALAGGGTQMNEFPADSCIGGTHYKYRGKACPFFTVLCCPCCKDTKAGANISNRCKLTG